MALLVATVGRRRSHSHWPDQPAVTRSADAANHISTIKKQKLFQIHRPLHLSRFTILQLPLAIRAAQLSFFSSSNALVNIFDRKGLAARNLNLFFFSPDILEPLLCQARHGALHHVQSISNLSFPVHH